MAMILYFKESLHQDAREADSVVTSKFRGDGLCSMSIGLSYMFDALTLVGDTFSI